MTQTLQTLQLILFAIPTLTLLAIGGVILIKPVSVINRRWYLLVFLPLLLANAAAILENDPSAGAFSSAANWRLWLVLIADLAMAVGVTLVFRGALVYGLNAAETEGLLASTLRDKGYEVHSHVGEKRVLWGSSLDARILTVNQDGQAVDLWITERFNEVIIHAESRNGFVLLKQALPEIPKVERPYDFKSHAMGILYIILAVVFAVLFWIFFFEPRLILIE